MLHAHQWCMNVPNTSTLKVLQSGGCKWHLIVSDFLDVSMSRMVWEVEPLFMCLVAICASSSVKCLFSLLPIFYC